MLIKRTFELIIWFLIFKANLVMECHEMRTFHTVTLKTFPEKCLEISLKGLSSNG